MTRSCVLRPPAPASPPPPCLQARMKQLVLEEVKGYFRPELLNRFDEQIVFHKLGLKEVCVRRCVRVWGAHSLAASLSARSHASCSACRLFISRACVFCGGQVLNCFPFVRRNVARDIP